MRLGVIYQPDVCPYYRAVDPLQAMERRGHEVVWPDRHGRFDLGRLAGCELVHVYRNATDDTRRAVAALARAGTAITYDNDDNMAALPKDAPSYRAAGGLAGQRIHALTVRLARLARTFTTPSEILAVRYRASGISHVKVIPNGISPDLPRPRSRHEGVVIGWVAGVDHQPDAQRLGIVEAVRAVQIAHSQVRVECVGVDLGLDESYQHDDFVMFRELPRRIGGFDIGIAPLVDNPLNRARSDIKVKEYAASGVPWLASPVGPYLGLGEREGGRLVPDGGWFEALERLVTQKRERKRLAQNAKRWASTQTVDAFADDWERVFVEAATRV